MGYQIILLSDNNSNIRVGSARPAAAYVLATRLKQAGFSVLVIEYFAQHPDPLSLIKNFISPDLLIIGFCTTFLMIPKTPSSEEIRGEHLKKYFEGELWFEEGTSLQSWMSQLRHEVIQKSPACKFLIGGVKAQYAIWRPEYYKEFDFVCLGPGDHAIVDLAKSLQDGKEPQASDFEGKKVLKNEADILKSECPRIQWEDHFFLGKKESIPIEIARGCLYNCKFCHHDKVQSIRKTSADLKEELTRNFEKFGVDTYYLTDDCINDHRAKVDLFYNSVISLPFKIEWVGFARVDVGIKFPETMNMLVEAGARGFHFGLESFNPKASLKAGKGTPPEKVKEFLIDIRQKFENDCLFMAGFIVGLPYETMETQMETCEWLLQNPVLDFLNIGRLELMPYVSSFDKLNIDYADYSRNPEKYGFRKVNFETKYWEHETFNSTQAFETAKLIKRQWNVQKKFQLFKAIWRYPHLKTLGYSKEQIFSMARDPMIRNTITKQQIIDRFAQHKENYYRRLNGSLVSEKRFNVQSTT